MNSFHGQPGGGANADRGSQAASKDGFYAGAAAGLTALVVDDDQRNRFALSVLLKRGRMAVLAAASGAAALEALEQRADIDIVLMDIMMPVMDGYQTMAAIRKQPAYRDLPIIAVTAKEADGERQRCIAAGASDYIPKPINAGELLGAISRWLPARQQRSLTRASERDGRERKAHTESLEHQPLYDGLTGVANRTLFEEHVLHALTSAKRNNDSRAVLLLHLDGFEQVNDRLGHDIGDMLIKQVAQRLVGALRENDTIARLDGDDFAVLPGDATDLAAATAVACKLQRTCEPRFVVDDGVVRVSARIGIAMFPEHGSTPAELVHHADTAMSVAKNSGSDQVVFAAADETRSTRQHALLIDLREAVFRGEMVLHYQAKIDLATREISGVEALVRWQHPIRGLLAPASFIPEVQRTELIEPITRWVLNEALHQQRIWRDDGIDLTMAVNISGHSLDPSSDLPETVAELIDAWSTEPGRLTLELTEHALTEAPAAPDILARLHGSGARISIDDFGTGYSSLAYLHRLPIDELKIDPSFVTPLAASDDQVIVRSTIDLAHNLNMTVVAEGVEDEAAIDLLTAYGCDSAQGYYFGRPCSADELTNELTHSPYGTPTRAGR